MTATWEEDFDNWKSAMWPVLTDRYLPLSADLPGAGDASPGKVNLVFTVKSLNDDDLKAAYANPVRTNQQGSSTKYFFNSAIANVAVNRELRNVQGRGDEIGSTRHLEIELAGTDLRYDTADNLAVLPINSDASVDALCKAMGYNPNENFTIEPISKDFKYPFPVPCTVKEALQKYFDIHGLPKHSLVSKLQPYVTSDKQRLWLEDLVDKNNHSGFKQYINGNGRSFFDLVTNELDQCSIPFEDLLHILPTMQPRYYTISSSSSVHPDRVHITVSVTDFKLPSGRRFRGLTSSYLQGLQGGRDSCRVFVRASHVQITQKYENSYHHDWTRDRHSPHACSSPGERSRGGQI